MMVEIQMRIGVVVGLATEARIARPLEWTVAIGGGTLAGATAAATTLVEQGCTSLISFGLAGGLDPALRPGALIVPSAAITGDTSYVTDPALSRMLGGPTPHVILGADAIVTSIAEKRRIHKQFGADAVDLESGAVAHIATSRGMPFAVLRAICDPAERALPPAAPVALDAGGRIRPWRVCASIAAHPAQLAGLLALAADATAAKRSLTARVSQIAQAHT
jgi:adenosylhomocysteine nucleosidase